MNRSYNPNGFWFRIVNNLVKSPLATHDASRRSFLNLAVATIFMALVIFCMFLIARIPRAAPLIPAARGGCFAVKAEKCLRASGIAFEW